MLPAELLAGLNGGKLLFSKGKTKGKFDDEKFLPCKLLFIFPHRLQNCSSIKTK
jgi:hypothetical protein